jgi:hypothetical protein
LAAKKRQAYYSDDGKRRYTPSELRRASKKIQAELMLSWFRANFMHPDNLPYDSEEGGYQWIWGPPSEPRDELESEFGALCSESAITELASDLEDQSHEWSPNPDLYPPDEDFFADSEPYEATPCEVMCGHLDSALLTHLTPFLVRQTLVQMVFANAITCLEVYLGSLFATEVKGNQARLERFLKFNTDFKEEKFLLSEIFAVSATIERRVGGYLSNMVWHNIAKVEHLYRVTLEINFPKSEKEVLLRAVADRHHIVHRNGLDNDGNSKFWEESEVHELVRVIRAFAVELEQQLGRTPCIRALPDPPF